ncbi:MAG: 4Fe-4S dicluster domain-containing protein, partial [Opitutales bacterium]
MSVLGQGMLKGMSVTLKNFVLSYFDRGRKERLSTVQYPEEGNTVTLFSRNFPFLIYDGDDSIEGMRCVGCQICERECPPACIYIVKELDENGKFIKRAKVFDIDISVCMGCQICVEVCPFDAIEMDSEFELSNANRFEGLLVDREQLLKSNDYYHQIHPDGARDRDANLAAKKAEEEAKKKAREAKMAEAKAKKEAEAKAKAEAPETLKGEGAKAEASPADEKSEASAEPPVAKESPANEAETSTEEPAEEAKEKPAPADEGE